ncbi:hypothetical protein [Hyphococcus luteus]|uniref:Uncharacterized protein n=1 Tax=Hyphococcus luteus TaxID=2058213 RepID=A0A2S7K7I1_9PROT|nr:hypothetical protein [Marinicaulis flavus]PQA88429.1 hypothetical protein CW354_09050 [Marinicaulis flavus]
MPSGTLEWKRGLFGPVTRIEYTPEAIIFQRADKTETILYTDIKDIYFKHEKAMYPFLHVISFDLASSDERQIRLDMSVFGLGGEKYSLLKKSISDILFNYQAVYRDAKVHIGIRQNKIMSLVFFGALALSLLFSFYQMKEEEYGDWWINLLAVALVFAIAIPVWYFGMKPKIKPVDEIINRLN